MRHLMHQSLGKPEMPAPAGRRIVTRQGDFTTQTPAPLRGGDSGGSFGGSARSIQRGGCASLTSRGRAFQPLQCGDALDQRRLVSGWIHRNYCLEHMFDSTSFH